MVKRDVIGMIIILNVVFTGSVFASRGWHFDANKGKADPNYALHVRGLTKNQDDITPDQKNLHVKLNAKEIHQAQVWNLSKEQEGRYVLLMQNKSGTYFKNTKLSPVQILGINARNDSERAYYATLSAEQERQYIAKTLAFNTAFGKAMGKLNKGIPVIRPFNYAKFSPYNYKSVALKDHDKLILFVHIKDAVAPVVSSLLEDVVKNPKIQFNVYFVGHDVTNDAIQTWANSQDIPPKLVQDKRITLNYDKEEHADIYKNKRTPVLLLVRSGKSKFVDIGRF